MQYYYPNYRSPQYNKPNQDNLDIKEFKYPDNLDHAIDLIKKAVDGEKDDELFYNQLISIAPTEEAIEILKGIRDDEKKHARIFQNLYNQLTNHVLPHSNKRSNSPPSSYSNGIKKAIKGELEAVEKYRKILYAMKERVHVNMITEVITDELRHGSLFNLLFSMRGC